jgi:hypothetical protein
LPLFVQMWALHGRQNWAHLNILHEHLPVWSLCSTNVFHELMSPLVLFQRLSNSCHSFLYLVIWGEEKNTVLEGIILEIKTALNSNCGMCVCMCICVCAHAYVCMWVWLCVVSQKCKKIISYMIMKSTSLSKNTFFLEVGTSALCLRKIYLQGHMIGIKQKESVLGCP